MKLFEKLNNVRKNKKGFTLVELVVVIAILAILALLLVPRIMGNVEDSKKSKEIANARTIASEISTHNALAKVNSDGSMIKSVTYAKDASDALVGTGTEDSLNALNRKVKDLPLESYAVIVVDSNGNASVDVKK